MYIINLGTFVKNKTISKLAHTEVGTYKIGSSDVMIKKETFDCTEQPYPTRTETQKSRKNKIKLGTDSYF